MGVRNRAGAGATLRSPLIRAGRALRQLPFVAEQVLEEVVAPLGRRGGPGDLDAAGDRVAALAAAIAAHPAETLRLDGHRLRLATNVGGRARAVCLAERVSARNQRDGLFVVHRHPAERLSNVSRRGNRIRGAVRPFRIHIDETHLHGAEWIRQLPVAAVARVSEPGFLSSPVDLRRLPDILAATAETERLETHRFEGAVACKDHQVRPRELPAVLLLDRPQQPSRLVEICVVRPAVERREALLPRARAAAAVGDAVCARAVPGHADEERTVVTVVGRPPVLRRRHHLLDVVLHGIEVEGLELLRVVESVAHRIARGRILVKDFQVQLIRPPVAVRLAAVRLARERALLLVFHVDVDLY